MQLPRALADGIESLIEGRDLKTIRRASDELSESYRTDKPKTALDTPEHRLAYLLIRLPATYAAVSSVLKEVRARIGDVRSVLDLGAGPGTAAWAATEIFPELERVALIERDVEMMAVGKKLAAGHSLLGHAQWITGDLRSVKFESHDLVIAAYALGELDSSDGPQAVTAKVWAASQKALAILEPGTPRGFASLLPLREALLAQGQHIAAPCPADAECPMQDRPGDWCHFAARLERTSLHRRLKSGELGYEDEKFSYVVFARDQAAPQAPARILRHPVHGKGHIKLMLCEAPKVREVTVAKSDGEAFRAARRARWGDPWPPAR
ncbi:MAG TPA: small ribosomal subunit Rsm22 family protein [Terriglobales bacterium]|nr:small ribosomal subunit Rsm22 family protein [Terriglobales bacterium]